MSAEAATKLEKAERQLRRGGPLEKLKTYLKALGHGLITGASDDDPSGIGTYAQTGAQFGYAQLWTALLIAPLMIAVQEICARIGLETGAGLAEVIRKHYPLQLMIMLIANDRKIMGNKTNGRVPNNLGWATTIAMTVAALALIFTVGLNVSGGP